MAIHFRASRYTSPEVAALTRADTKRRYNDQACPRSIGADSHPHDRPFVCPICPRYEYSDRATEKYLSDLYFHCNLRFHRPVYLRLRYYNQQK